MAVPWVTVFAETAILAAVGIPLVYGLSRLLKLAPPPIVIENPSREAHVAVLVLVAAFAIVIVANWTLGSASVSWSDPMVLLRFVAVYAVVLATVFVAARATWQSWASVGLSRRTLFRMVVLGLVASAIYLAIAGLFSPGTGFAGPVALAIGFVANALAAFGEETLMRGYIQTRFEAAWGTWVGYALTVVVFTFYHFPGSYVLYSGNVPDALLSTLARLGGALLLGYFYIRSRNVVPGTIFHMFYNWAAVLWQVSPT